MGWFGFGSLFEAICFGVLVIVWLGVIIYAALTARCSPEDSERNPGDW